MLQLPVGVLETVPENDVVRGKKLHRALFEIDQQIEHDRSLTLAAAEIVGDRFKIALYPIVGVHGDRASLALSDEYGNASPYG